MTIASFILSLLCIFEIICVPAIFLHIKLQGVIVLCLILTAVFVMVLWKKKKLPRPMKKQRKYSGKVTGKLLALCALCILFQLILVTGYRHTDDDDAWYLGIAVSAYETGEMFAYSPYTGASMELSDGGDYVLSPLPVLWAALGKLFHIHPTILAHTVAPVFMLLWAYYIYWLLGKRLFGRKDEDAGAAAFLLFMNVLNLFGFYSTRTSGTFLLFRSWQGKAVFCAILVPCLFYYFLGLLQSKEQRGRQNGRKPAGNRGMEEKETAVNEKRELLGIYLTMGAGCLASFSAASLMPLLLFAMALTYAITDRSVKLPLKMCGAAIPNIILAAVYVFVL